MGYTVNGQNIPKVLDKCDPIKLQKYIAAGADLNLKVYDYDDNGEELEISYLTYAVHAECLPCIEILVENKDQIEDFDLVVTQAFIYSLSVGDDAISSFLYKQDPIAHGICDVCHGNNALMVAATYGREDWYFKLKEKSDVKYVNAANATLLHAAASGPSQKILDDVLAIEGLDINRKDQEELTPLDYAATNSDNKKAFETLISKGADHKQAWNLMYWWAMYPDLPLSDQMIADRRADVWMIDHEGENCLMLLSYFFHELETEQGKFESQLRTVLEIMIEDHEKGTSDLSFVTQFYSEGITNNILDAMLYIEDFNSEAPVYELYLKFLGILCEEAEFCPVYKKEYKTAKKIYGVKVDEWYEKYNLPTE